MSLLGGISGTSGVVDGTQSADSKAQLEDDLNRFLSLLIAQLKNQDPLDPMDSNEFTQQLVQFASVEQQIFQNSNLEKLLEIQQTNQISSMVDFIDTMVEAEGKKLPVENGRGEFSYTMPFGAKSATIVITNSSGLTVHKSDAVLDQGTHSFVWDGKDNYGVQQKDGSYNVLVSGLNQYGELLEISHTIFGRVTGVGAQDGSASLFLGDIEVNQDKVLSVKEAPAKE